MLCPKCRSDNPAGAVFCNQCGKKLTTQKKSRTKSRGNGTGTAFKRGSTWTAQVVLKYKELPDDLLDPENKKPRLKITRSKSGFKTKDAALQYCPILKNGPQKPKEAPTLSHYWDTYQNGAFTALSSSKKTSYRTAWGRLESIKDTRIDQLTVSALQDLLVKKCKTFHTMKPCKTLLQNLFRIAAAEGYANESIPSFIQLPKVEETERIPFSETEQAAIWKQYESGDIRAAVPLLMIYTGMMPGEARELSVSQIDLASRKIIGAGLKTKVRKETPIVLAESIIPVVEDLIRHARKNGKIFTWDKEAWYKDYYDALEAAGVRKLSPYSCRHTTATALAISENIAPQTVKKVMRWSTSKMLDRYAHPDQADALAAVDSIGSAR